MLSAAEEKAPRRRFAIVPSELHHVYEDRVEEGNGIDCPVLAVGMAGIGAPYAFALGAGVFQPRFADAEA